MLNVHDIPPGVQFSFEKTLSFLLDEINLRLLEGAFALEQVKIDEKDIEFERSIYAGGTQLNVKARQAAHRLLLIEWNDEYAGFRFHFETDDDFKDGTITLSAAQSHPLTVKIEQWIKEKGYEDNSAEEKALAERQGAKRKKADEEIVAEQAAYKRQKQEEEREKERAEKGCLCVHKSTVQRFNPGDFSYVQEFTIGKKKIHCDSISAELFQCENCKKYFGLEVETRDIGAVQVTVTAYGRNPCRDADHHSTKSKTENQCICSDLNGMTNESFLQTHAQDYKQLMGFKNEGYWYVFECKSCAQQLEVRCPSENYGSVSIPVIPLEGETVEFIQKNKDQLLEKSKWDLATFGLAHVVKIYQIEFDQMKAAKAKAALKVVRSKPKRTLIDESGETYIIENISFHQVASNGDHYSLSVNDEGVQWGISGPPQMTMSSVGGTGGYLTYEEFLAGKLRSEVATAIGSKKIQEAKKNARMRIKWKEKHKEKENDE